MHHLFCTVTENRKICSNYYRIAFSWKHDASPPLPGQFLTIRPGADTLPLLRRPFAFSGYDPTDQRVEIIYERRGNATVELSSKMPGDELDILGPLGHPFPDADHTRKPVLVAGGIGMGPVFYLAEQLQHRGRKPILFVGARTEALVPDLPLFERVETYVATDDGSRGVHGTSIDALSIHAPSRESEYFACGPMPMLRALAVRAREQQAPCWVSLEQTMGCAVGACMGCVVHVTGGNGYARVCTEGPIFNAEEIRWT